MKNSLYVIAGLLLVIWGLIYWGFNSSSGILHTLLVAAGVIILIRLIFNKQLSK